MNHDAYVYIPEDLRPKAHPEVNRSGVAAHRQNDPARPRYDPGFAD